MAAASPVSLKSVALVHNRTTDPDNVYREKVTSFLEQHGLSVHVIAVENRNMPVLPPITQNVDLLLVLGGDGTVLRTAQAFAQRQVPLVGINTGKLGFLTRIDPDTLDEALERLVSGRFQLEPRTMLAVQLPNTPPELMALNDVLVKSSNASQMGSFKVFINNQEIATYDADGVIIATPTGSTAYTMSAGGPVISPEVQAVAITPICPHSLSAKPVVVPLSKTIRVQSVSNKDALIVAVDGQECGTLESGETVTIHQSPRPMQFVTFQPEEEDFYPLLRRKLHWAMNPRWKTS